MAESLTKKEGAPGFLVFVNSFRWLTWLLAVVLTLLKVTPKFPWEWTLALYSLVFLYNLAFTFFPARIESWLRRWPPLILLDVAFCTFLLGVYGWRSPFTIYSFSPVLLGGYLWQITGGFIIAALMGVGYLLVEPINGYSWAELKRLDYMDSHIAHFFNYFLVAVFFSYPTYLWLKLDKTNKGLKDARSKLETFNRRLATLQDVNVAIQESLELDEILEKIAGSLVKHLGFDRASVGLATSAKKSSIEWLLSMPNKHFCNELQKASDSSFFKRLLWDNKPLGEVDIEEGEPLVDVLGSRKLAAFPLIKGDQRLGILLVDNSFSGKKIDNDDLEILRLFAHQASVAVNNAQSYRQSQEARLIEERNRIASEMHDNVIQSLYGMRLMLEACLRDSVATPQLAKRLKEVLSISADILEELRSTIDNLYEMRIGKQRLTHLAKEQARKFAGSGDLQISVSVKGTEPDLPASFKKDLYLIIQEIISNIVKHAQATKVRVFIEFSPEEIGVRISDDGIGFHPSAVTDEGRAGVGLRTISSRLEKLGGKISFESAGDRGTKVVICVPCSVIPLS